MCCVVCIKWKPSSTFLFISGSVHILFIYSWIVPHVTQVWFPLTCATLYVSLVWPHTHTHCKPHSSQRGRTATLELSLRNAIIKHSSKKIRCWHLLNMWRNSTPWQRMRSAKSMDLFGHIKFMPWRQLDGCSVTSFFLSAKGVACKTNTCFIVNCIRTYYIHVITHCVLLSFRFLVTFF